MEKLLVMRLQVKHLPRLRPETVQSTRAEDTPTKHLEFVTPLREEVAHHQ